MRGVRASLCEMRCIVSDKRGGSGVEVAGRSIEASPEEEEEGGIVRKTLFLLPCHACCPTIRKIYIPEVEDTEDGGGDILAIHLSIGGGEEEDFKDWIYNIGISRKN